MDAPILDPACGAGVFLVAAIDRLAGAFVRDGRALRDRLNVRSLRDVTEQTAALRAAIREQIRKSRPSVVVLMLCSKVEAERYRDGAEAFVDRVFFEEEIEECLEFLRIAAQSD
jgi:hypothetical protein